MTPELEEKLTEKISPFDWITFYINEDIKLSDLRQSLLVMYELLLIEDYAELNICHDWWEHDSFQLNAKKIHPKDYLAFLNNNTSIYNAADEDFAVRIGIYPNSFEWYLRFNIDEEFGGIPDKELGNFDLTLSLKYKDSPIINETKKIIKLENMQAFDFFKESYGG